MNAKENKCNHNLTLNDITLKNNDSNNNNSKTQQNVVLFAIIITTTTRSQGINKQTNVEIMLIQISQEKINDKVKIPISNIEIKIKLTKKTTATKINKNKK